jgi:hypothetical protein
MLRYYLCYEGKHLLKNYTPFIILFKGSYYLYMLLSKYKKGIL